MGLTCLVFSHKNTPIAFRERIHFDQNAIANACARFRCGDSNKSPLVELSILSTCNRTEIYSFTPNQSAESNLELDNSASRQLEDQKATLLQFVSQARDISIDELESSASWKIGPSAIEHLARVASGLESMVLGEPQILGQVGDAMRFGLMMNSAGPVLSKLFQTAIACGRRVRTDTEIGHHSGNISTLAVNSVERELGTLKDKSVVLLGAGDMADLALSQLIKKQVHPIHVVNRTMAKARELAAKYGGVAHVFERLRELLPQADVLITSTGAPHTLISKEMIAMVMQSRPDRSLAILDIAVPRDVDVTVDEVPNVWRCDIDNLQNVASDGMRSREAAIPEAEQIIELELDRFLDWYRGVGVEQTVVSLRRKTEEIRSGEFSRMLSLLPDLSDQTKQVLEQFSHSLTNKLLHDPTCNLRHLKGTRSAIDYGEAVRELFDLSTESEVPDSNEKPGHNVQAGSITE